MELAFIRVGCTGITLLCRGGFSGLMGPEG